MEVVQVWYCLLVLQEKGQLQTRAAYGWSSTSQCSAVTYMEILLSPDRKSASCHAWPDCSISWPKPEWSVIWSIPQAATRRISFDLAWPKSTSFTVVTMDYFTSRTCQHCSRPLTYIWGPDLHGCLCLCNLKGSQNVAHLFQSQSERSCLSGQIALTRKCHIRVKYAGCNQNRPRRWKGARLNLSHFDTGTEPRESFWAPGKAWFYWMRVDGHEWQIYIKSILKNLLNLAQTVHL